MSEGKRYSDEEAEAILRLAARRSQGGVTRDRLAQMAGELGIDAETLARAEREFAVTHRLAAEKEAFRSDMRREFLSHLGIFAAVNVGLVAMDIIKDGHLSWSIWPVVGWGIGIACHFASLIVTDPEDEAKDFQKWREKKRQYDPDFAAEFEAVPVDGARRAALEEIDRIHT